MFVMLLVATGQWVRIVPGSWDNLHNAASAFQQYASLQWPLENCWVNDNALQVLSYLAIVFIAAPLALLSGLRRSPAWPKNAALNKAYPLAAARAVHVPVMVYFVAFVAVHVTLVLTDGALQNLNHMYGAREGGGWLGFWIFVLSLAIMSAGWFLARPLFLRPIASLTGKLSR